MAEAQQELPIVGYVVEGVGCYGPAVNLGSMIRFDEGVVDAGYWKRRGYVMSPVTDHAKATAIIADLRTRLEAAEKDAARYLEIRSRFDTQRTSRCQRALEALGIEGDASEPLDRLIDGALNTKEPI